MIEKSLIIVLICVGVVLGFFSVFAPNVNQISLLEADSTVYDCGEIPQGQPQTCRVRLMNSGSVTICLLEAQASCSCTVAVSPQITLGPDESTFTEITWNPGLKRGKRKTACLFPYTVLASSDRKIHYLKVSLTAVVQPDIKLVPDVLVFDASLPQTRELLLLPGVAKKFTILSAKSNHPAFTVEEAKRNSDKDKLTVEFKPELWDGISTIPVIEIQTNTQHEKVIRVPIRVRPQHDTEGIL